VYFALSTKNIKANYPKHENLKNLSFCGSMFNSNKYCGTRLGYLAQQYTCSTAKNKLYKKARKRYFSRPGIENFEHRAELLKRYAKCKQQHSQRLYTKKFGRANKNGSNPRPVHPIQKNKKELAQG